MTDLLESNDNFTIQGNRVRSKKIFNKTVIDINVMNNKMDETQIIFKSSSLSKP